MPFGLTIGTERATALQKSIQDELTKREYSAEDPVMAEYITIMIINNKTAAQITSELEDLIGTDFDPTFTDWLFTEAARGAPDAEPPSQPAAVEQLTARDPPPHLPADSSRRTATAPRTSAPLYQQALSQAIPSTSPSAQKRTASARSPSPNGHGPSKSRRMDLPTGPRAMQRDGGHIGPSNSRSLLERVGGPAGRNGTGFQRDDIQARIDNITNNPSDPGMMMGGFPNGMGGMDMNTMGMGNPMMLQELMMNQMAMMAQMASSMGMANPANGQYGFPMQGVLPGDMPGFNAGGMNGFVGGPQQQQISGQGRGRGTVRGRGIGRGRGGGPSTYANGAANETTTTMPTTIVAPTPTLATPVNPTPPVAPPAPAPSQRLGYVLPERPQSPTLCKFGMKCTNALCRYSHPSPVATAESGIVLSNEACDKGKDCKDKDCIKSHISPAVNLPVSEQHNSNGIQQSPATTPHAPNTVACRFGAACTRPGCTYSHPPRPSQANHFAQQCRFGAGCTRATCPFQHPEGRVLPTTFHRGLSITSPLVNVPTPEAGSMGAVQKQNRSVKFNNSGSTKDVQAKLAKLEAQKAEAEKAVAEAEAVASKKETKSVAITA